MQAYFEKELGMYGYFSKAMAFEGGSYGILLLSKVPFSKTETYDYQTHGSEPRVLQVVEMNVKGQKLRVGNTHLSYETIALRQEQMRELITVMGEDASVITGDFNTDQTIQEWSDFSLPFDMVNGQDGDFFDTFQKEDETMKTKAIDNILYGKDLILMEKEIKLNTISDHGLLRADFTFNIEEKLKSQRP